MAATCQRHGGQIGRGCVRLDAADCLVFAAGSVAFVTFIGFIGFVRTGHRGHRPDPTPPSAE